MILAGDIADALRSRARSTPDKVFCHLYRAGAATRIRSTGFQTRKSFEDLNFDHQPALNRDMIAHLGTGAFLAKARNVVLLGPPEAG